MSFHSVHCLIVIMAFYVIWRLISLVHKLAYQYFAGSRNSKPTKLFSDKESITTPFYPEYYPPKKQCLWIVSAPQNHVVAFQFTDYDIGPGDYVDIRDGGTNEAPLLRSFTNKPKLRHWWFSSGKSIWVKFKSNKHFTFKGLKIRTNFVKKSQGSDIF